MPDQPAIQPNDTEKILPKRWHSLLHTLWPKATSQPSYEKTEWMELEQILIQCHAKLKKQAPGTASDSR
jgi:hypothetical protein